MSYDLYINLFRHPQGRWSLGDADAPFEDEYDTLEHILAQEQPNIEHRGLEYVTTLARHDDGEWQDINLYRRAHLIAHHPTKS